MSDLSPPPLAIASQISLWIPGIWPVFVAAFVFATTLVFAQPQENSHRLGSWRP